MESRSANLRTADATVLGAAILGGVGVGIFASIEEGADKLVRSEHTYEPIVDNTALYDELYDIYCRTYEQLENNEIFSSLASLQAKRRA